MKKNFLNNLLINSSLYVYDDYGFEKDSSFLKKGFMTIEETEEDDKGERGTTTRIIHPRNDLINEFEKSKNTYLVAKTTLYDPNCDDDTLLSLKNKIKKFEIQNYGKNFYTELGQTDFSSLENLISFVKIWGLPTGVSYTKDIGSYYPSNDINILFMPLDQFNQKVTEYQSVFKVFKAMATQDFENITDAERQNFDKQIEAKSLFSFRLNTDVKNNSFTPIAVFNDLFDFAYYFLNMAMYSGAEMRKCEHCGHIFEVTHNRQRFCHPLPGRKRSSCEMAFNNRKKHIQKA